MPKIFEYFGFIFYFFSNEHEPIHVHVKHSGTECIFDLIIENGELKDIVRREKQGAKPLDSKDEKVAVEFINKYWQRIVEKWIDFFVMKKVVKTTYIRKDVTMEHIFITSAEDAGNLCVRLTFNDGHQSVVDIGDFIRRHPHPQYNKYLDPEVFRTFVVDDGNVVWGEDWDLIFPIENLYSGKAA